MPRPRYRLGQGLRALAAFVTPPVLALAGQRLSDCEYAAFLQLSRADQLHSLRVLRAVLDANLDAPEALAKAALLHDIGKSRYRLAVWQKSLAVLAKSIAPKLSQQWGAGESLSLWRAPFEVRAHHARWGGAILRSCETAEAVIWLTENHQRSADELRGHALHGLLIALQRADNAS